MPPLPPVGLVQDIDPLGDTMAKDDSVPPPIDPNNLEQVSDHLNIQRRLEVGICCFSCTLAQHMYMHMCVFKK